MSNLHSSDSYNRYLKSNSLFYVNDIYSYYTQIISCTYRKQVNSLNMLGVLDWP